MTKRDWIGVLVLAVAVVPGVFFIAQLHGDVRDLKEGAAIDVPGSAVVAFDGAECPLGWADYGAAEGRFIVGVGRHSEYNRYGTEVPMKTIGESGGEDQVVLGIAHMPRHRHMTPSRGNSGNLNQVYALQAVDRGQYGPPHSRPTDYAGGDAPYDNLPPYIALRFCTPE